MTNLEYLNHGWLELESDPGLFTLLIEDFGCKNVQVEEIYDLSKVNLIEDTNVYGFIFLFKWTEERRSRHRQMFISNNTQSLNNKNRSTSNNDVNNPQNYNHEPYYVEDENLVNSMFFAHQIVPNSCASHALLSVLLNCNNINIGECLSRFKEMTNLMDPESKGIAIGNMPELARSHNLHSSEIDMQEKRSKQAQTKTNTAFPRASSGDSFHFISFVNINNRVYELDGLKKFPIDHGPIKDNETFSEKLRKIILERIPQQQQKENKLNLQLRKLQTDMNTAINEEIRYSLMAVVPDRRRENMKRLQLLKSEKSMLLEILEKIMEPAKLPEPYETHNYSKYSVSNDRKTIELEANANKFTIKDVNFNDHQNSKLSENHNLTTKDSLSDNQSDNFNQDDDDNSTDTCSECESFRLSDDESFDEDHSKINSLYAFKFVPLKEQNNDKNQMVKNSSNDKKLKMEDDKNSANSSESSTTNAINSSNASNSNSSNNLINSNQNNQNNTSTKSINLNCFKTFSKSELIDFYRDYGLKDLLNILSKIDQEISICDRNIKEETEKRTKFYVDDSRRTHNYSEFITTYLLMITEQKKLHEFVDAKEKAPVASASNGKSSNNNDHLMECDDLPTKFFKEILTNYEDVLMKDDDEQEPPSIKNESNGNVLSKSMSSPNNKSTSSNNNSSGKSNNTSSNNTRSNGRSNNSSINNNTSVSNQSAAIDNNQDKRKRRPTRTPVTKGTRKEKVK